MCIHKPIFILLIAALVPAFTTQGAVAAEPTLRTQLENAAPIRLPDRITTLDGKTYEKVVLDKVDPDGLLVLFSPVEGGSGTAKLKFRNLPVELRERYGYDADQAADYEAAQARGEALWRVEHAVWMEKREAARAEHAALERQMRAEAESRRVEAEKAQAESARYAQEQPVAYYYPWWSLGWYDAGHRSGGRRFKNHVPRPKPVSSVTGVPSSPVFRPMRPSGK